MLVRCIRRGVTSCVHCVCERRGNPRVKFRIYTRGAFFPLRKSSACVCESDWEQGSSFAGAGRFANTFFYICRGMWEGGFSVGREMVVNRSLLTDEARKVWLANIG